MKSALGSGTRLGPYEIVDAIGAGGMGEVYRATDTRLKRQVALKVLPQEFAEDAERLARFEREARTLAALNHPHIAQIYGLEQSGGTSALIMELVEGDDLSERIRRGPMPLDDVLPMARQIAEALEAAHDVGIIHRDLKPANIKVRADGTVKVLDFGLAKALDPAAASSPHLANSPTLTAQATQAGIILGTAAYMAPEQAKGRAVGKRADVWAFGVVLFEMLTGRRAFEGDDVSDTLAAVLMREPDWSALPSGLSPTLVVVLKRCLHKDWKHRVTDIGAVRLALEGAFETAADQTSAPAPSTSSRGARAFIAVSGVALLSLAAGVIVTILVQGPLALRETTAVRFEILPPDKTSFASGLPGARSTSQLAGSVSPDGRRVAFTARTEAGQVMLWVRALDAVTAQPLLGTEGAGFPFWSPDSRSIGFFTRGNLKRVDVGGGPVQPICAAPSGRGGTWNRDGVIVFAGDQSTSLLRVSASGDEPSPVTTLGDGETGHWFPSFLPDGRHFLYWRLGADVTARAVMVGSLESPETKRLFAADSPAAFAPPGYLLFARQGTLLAQTFDVGRLETAGDAIPIAEQVASDGLGSGFSVSETGTLVYRVGSAAPRYQLTWVDRRGAVVGSLGEPALYQSPVMAPDGKHVAVHRHDATGGDIWLLEVAGGRTSRLTFDASQDNSQPLWSPDGTRIVFGSRRNNKWGIYQKLANGTGAEELLFESDKVLVPMSWSATTVLFYAGDPKNGFDVWALPLTGDRKPVPLLQTAFNENHPQISPDGKWFAYTSDETGRGEIYVQTLPPGGGKWQVSASGGVFPRWRPDGKELFWMERVNFGRIVAVAIDATGSTFGFSAPRPLFDSGYSNAAPGHVGNWNTFDASRDGTRFLIPRPEASLADPPLAVVINWTVALNRK